MLCYIWIIAPRIGIESWGAEVFPPLMANWVDRILDSKSLWSHTHPVCILSPVMGHVQLGNDTANCDPVTFVQNWELAQNHCAVGKRHRKSWPSHICSKLGVVILILNIWVFCLGNSPDSLLVGKIKYRVIYSGLGSDVKDFTNFLDCEWTKQNKKKLS